MKKNEKFDLKLILIWPIIASVITIFLEEKNIFYQNFFVSIILFLALPAIYLSFRAKQYVLKTLIVSTLGSIPIMIVVEYLGQISGAWSFPVSIFSFKLFGFVILEVLFWAFFNMYYIIIFYEYFLDHHITKHLWEPRMKYLFWGLLIGFVSFLFIIFNFTIPVIPYFYFFFGIIVFAIPVILQFTIYSHAKKVLVKILKASAYFFYLSFIYEIVALHYGWWGFPSENYIGWVNILGVRFPFEELVWWIMLFALAVLSSYEFFDDNEK